jgi:hypothetical protein
MLCYRIFVSNLSKTWSDIAEKKPRLLLNYESRHREFERGFFIWLHFRRIVYTVFHERFLHLWRKTVSYEGMFYFCLSYTNIRKISIWIIIWSKHCHALNPLYKYSPSGEWLRNRDQWFWQHFRYLCLTQNFVIASKI